MRTMEYIKGQWELFVSQASIIILINLILLTSTPLNKSLSEIFYLDLLVVIIAGVGCFSHFYRLNKVYTGIRRTVAGAKNIGEIYNQESVLLEVNIPGISLIKELLDYKCESFSRKENDYRQKMNDLKDYLTQSVHDLKVNLSICEMVVNRLENDMNIADKLLFQIEQMKFRINQILSIARANHYSEDIVSENVDIEQVVKDAISDNAEFFINRGISIQSHIEPYHFISDKKWIHYIVTQILNNSSKYTEKGGEITIFSRKDEKGYYLHLKDNGIGIPEEELNRVFDKGFTGSNGRSNIKSTGMGMYYAKKIAKVLGIGIAVQSKRGEYTEFIISFYHLSDYMQRQIS